MKILLVDDTKDNLDTLATALAPTGYQFTKTTKPEQALEFAKAEKYDLIITDINMPDMTGIELMEKIKESQPSQVFILITAFREWEDRIKYFDSFNPERDGFFVKPIELKVLVDFLWDLEKKLYPERVDK